MSQAKKVWEYLLKCGFITARKMAVHPFYINAPHSVIRDLRKKYGAEMILDEWVTKTRKVYYGNGKEEKVTIRFKKYFLAKMEG
jgi:hypothetical protein